MANWASTAYRIEGPHETLKKIEQAILHPTLLENESEGWEGAVLRTLGINWESKDSNEKDKYMRGFIQDEPSLGEDTLEFYAEEAWGLTDFSEVLKKNFPDIKIYWIVEEPGCEVYATNDKEGKYFPERYWVDICIDGEYQSEYFITKEDALDWISEITNGRVKTEEDVESFESDYEDSDALDENYICIHEFDVID